jgi:thiaminase
MEKFKGTKGKWNISTDDKGNHYMNVSGNYEFVKIYSGDSDFIVKMQKANALLISKAPEMLEMLDKIVFLTDNFQVSFQDFKERYNLEIKQLIKEATEI